MKQYTTPEQTAKLIELGFKKPRLLYIGNVIIGQPAYTIGELIEMLDGQCIEIAQITDYCRVSHKDCDKSSDELIDALYAVLIELKEKEII